jgi:hypothetical protein
MTKPETKRQRLEILRSQLEQERSSFIPHWQELGDFVLPRRLRLNTSDVNKGDRRNRNIVDSTATQAARTLRSGMMSGVTSPARPWFRLTVSDPKLAEMGVVKEWLHNVSQLMATAFLRSNLYNVLPTVYGDIGTFATSAMYVEEDFQSVFRAYAFPIGSYTIANNERLQVNVFFRTFNMTVRQLVEKFGRVTDKRDIDWSNFSAHVKDLWDMGQKEQWIEVVHAIVPNEEYSPKKLESKHKKFLSCYYETGSNGSAKANYMSSEGEKYLSEKGYDYFPVLCPRWEVTGEDVYGTECPGMQALGDIKGLQVLQKRKAQAIEKMVNPPMVAPSILQNKKASIVPGEVTYVDEPQGRAGFRPAHEVNPRITELVMDAQEHQRRISRAFYEDLFLMLANSDRRTITAREIDERHEEKLLALGPVLEQLNQDLLDPLIDIVFAIMVEQGQIPEPPKELQGQPLKVEYISIMAQAQKLIGIGGVERFMSFVGQVAQINQAVLDKIDADQAIDIYGDMTSMPPGLIRSDEEVAEMRGQRQEAQAAQAKQESIQAMASTAKELSQTSLEGDNALKKMMASAQAGSLVN